MVPPFDSTGNLPAGIHWTTRNALEKRFGWNTHRQELLVGLKKLMQGLQKAGCVSVYVDGSFVTAKVLSGDFDACWSVDGVDIDLLDPVLLDFDNERSAHKAKYFGDIFPAELPEGVSGKTFLEFFQTDKATGDRKGIVGVRLRRKRR